MDTDNTKLTPEAAQQIVTQVVRLAYASLTTQTKLATGMHLLLDYGRDFSRRPADQVAELRSLHLVDERGQMSDQVALAFVAVHNAWVATQ